MSGFVEDLQFVELYQEAADWLSSAAEESQKTSHVNLEKLMSGCENSLALVQQLREQEQDEFRKTALEQLTTSVHHSLGILRAKKAQLDTGQQASQIDTEPTAKAKDHDQHKAQRKLIVEDTIIQRRDVSFEDVAGLHEAKGILREAIIMPIQYPHLFTGGLQPWKRILLYGPPGTGKSRLAQAVSREIDSTFYSVSSADLISSWVGESEKIIKELFQHATQRDGRSVVFIDEIDSICRSRSSSEEEYTRRVKTELLRQMEGADNMADGDKIFLLCATNRPWELDSAFRRRFQKMIYIPLPDRNYSLCFLYMERDARTSILQIHTASSGVSFSDDDLLAFADRTEGYSGSDLANLILSALYEPVREMQKATHWIQASDGTLMPCEAAEEDALETSIHDLPPDRVRPRPITMQDFLKALDTCHSSISQTELQKFTDFTAKFGQCG